MNSPSGQSPSDSDAGDSQQSNGDTFFQGVLYMMLGSVLFAIADAFGKLVTASFPLSQVIWLRSVFGMLLIALVILIRGKRADFKTVRFRAHLTRSLAGISMTVCMLTGLKYIPLAEVTSLVFSTPLIVSVYSAIVLKEPVSRKMFIAIITGFAGVLIVVRPTPDHFHFAHLAMLGFALSSAYLSITARALVKTESPLTLNLYIYPATIILGSGFAWHDWVAPDLISWVLFFCVAFFATLAMLSITKAVHCATPARVAPFDYTRIIWTVSIGFLFWGELPDGLTWVGIAVIMLCGLYIIRQGRKA
jgi:drug/metabolite transporter (DMT)-like permease